MSQQTEGTTRRVEDTQCAQAYKNSLQCEFFRQAVPPGAKPLHCDRLPACSGLCAGPPTAHKRREAFPGIEQARSAQGERGLATALPPPAAAPAASPALLSLRLKPAGLDKNNYDKSKCRHAFDDYKKCKKEQVGSSRAVCVHRLFVCLLRAAFGAGREPCRSAIAAQQSLLNTLTWCACPAV